MRWFLFICIFCLALPCSAVPMNGVFVNERIIRLPEDGQKFYISVVGKADDARYNEVLNWFENGRLKELKDQVHFIPVTTDTAMYAERYQKTLKGLPTVRVQDAGGIVLYEASGVNLPMSGPALYNAIANAVNGPGEFLPWRERNKKTPEPQPQPTPEPQPGPIDPAPQPIDSGGPPVIEPVDNVPVSLIILCGLLLLAGLVYGQVELYRKGK